MNSLIKLTNKQINENIRKGKNEYYKKINHKRISYDEIKKIIIKEAENLIINIIPFGNIDFDSKMKIKEFVIIEKIIFGKIINDIIHEFNDDVIFYMNKKIEKEKMNRLFWLKSFYISYIDNEKKFKIEFNLEYFSMPEKVHIQDDPIFVEIEIFNEYNKTKDDKYNAVLEYIKNNRKYPSKNDENGEIRKLAFWLMREKGYYNNWKRHMKYDDSRIKWDNFNNECESYLTKDKKNINKNIYDSNQFGPWRRIKIISFEDEAESQIKLNISNIDMEDID